MIKRAKTELKVYQTEKFRQLSLKSMTVAEITIASRKMPFHSSVTFNAFHSQIMLASSEELLSLVDFYKLYIAMLPLDLSQFCDGNSDQIRNFLRIKSENQISDVILQEDYPLAKCSERLFRDSLKWLVGETQYGYFSIGQLQETFEYNDIENEKKLKKKEIIPDSMLKEVSDRIRDNIIPIMTHHSNEEFQPIDNFQNVLLEYFYDLFDDKLWKVVKKIFKDIPMTQKLLEPFHHCLELKTENEELSFKKREKFGVEQKEREYIEKIEKYEHMRVKMLETKKELVKKTVELENMEKKVMEVKKQSDENARDLKEDHERKARKLQDELESSKKLENRMKEERIEMEKTLKIQINNIKHGYRDEIQKLKEESNLKDNRIDGLQKELKECRDELKNEREKKYDEIDEELKIANENLRKMKNELEYSRLNEKTKDREISELKEQNEQWKIRIQIMEEKIDENKSENLVKEILEENNNDLEMINGILNLDNKLLKNDVVEISKKFEHLEKRVFSGLRDPIKLCPQVELIKKKYVGILEKNYDDIVDRLSSNLQRIAISYPKSFDVEVVRLEVRNFDENFDEYIENVKNELKKIQDNPNIRLDELALEIRAFPSKTLMKKYKKLLKKYNVEEIC